MDAQMLNLLFLASIFAIFYFLMIRPQAKRQREQSDFIQSIQKGDEIVTSSGIIGKINKIEDDTVQIQVDQKTFLTFTRGSVNKEMTDAYHKSRSKANG